MKRMSRCRPAKKMARRSTRKSTRKSGKRGSWLKKCGRKWRSMSAQFRRRHKWRTFIKQRC